MIAEVSIIAYFAPFPEQEIFQNVMLLKRIVGRELTSGVRITEMFDKAAQRGPFRVSRKKTGWKHLLTSTQSYFIDK